MKSAEYFRGEKKYQTNFKEKNGYKKRPIILH